MLGGPDERKPAWKLDVDSTFRHNWANPERGRAESPGCHFRFVRGDVEFFLLDGRYFRTDPAADAPSMLGPRQLTWLLDAVAASRAKFKILCSPVPWTFESKGKSKDTWNGYREERQRIFGFLAERKIEGVVLISADRHRSDAWKIERDGAYDLYEFSSSRLTNEHVHKTMDRALFSYNEKQSFGLVTIDTTIEDPSIVYRVVSIDGDEVEQLELSLSQLR